MATTFCNLSIFLVFCLKGAVESCVSVTNIPVNSLSEPYVISSFFYGDYYSNLQHCWRITSTGHVDIWIQRYEIETSFDQLKIYDGNSTSGALLEDLTGSGYDLPISSTGNSILIQLIITESSIPRKGFQACICHKSNVACDIRCLHLLPDDDDDGGFADEFPIESMALSAICIFIAVVGSIAFKGYRYYSLRNLEATRAQRQAAGAQPPPGSYPQQASGVVQSDQTATSPNPAAVPQQNYYHPQNDIVGTPPASAFAYPVGVPYSPVNPVLPLAGTPGTQSSVTNEVIPTIHESELPLPPPYEVLPPPPTYASINK